MITMQERAAMKIAYEQLLAKRNPAHTEAFNDAISAAAYELGKRIIERDDHDIKEYIAAKGA